MLIARVASFLFSFFIIYIKKTQLARNKLSPSVNVIRKRPHVGRESPNLSLTLTQGWGNPYCYLCESGPGYIPWALACRHASVFFSPQPEIRPLGVESMTIRSASETIKSIRLGTRSQIYLPLICSC